MSILRLLVEFSGTVSTQHAALHKLIEEVESSPYREIFINVWHGVVSGCSAERGVVAHSRKGLRKVSHDEVPLHLSDEKSWETGYSLRSVDAVKARFRNRCKYNLSTVEAVCVKIERRTRYLEM